MKRVITMFAVLMALAFHAGDLKACTGISLTAADGSRVVARTVEWAATPMQCGYVVAPRGHAHQSYTPTGDNGLKYSAVYGYVGIYTEYEPFVVEGINEAGLSAGLFFFRNTVNMHLTLKQIMPGPSAICSLSHGCCHNFQA